MSCLGRLAHALRWLERAMPLSVSNLVHLPEQDESHSPPSELLLMDPNTMKRVLKSLHLSSWLNQVFCLCLL
ncbi:hypothetical protein WJX77_000084 [Trebouxia sp. C0004]